MIIASEDLTDEGLKYLGYLPNLNTVEIGAYRGEFPKQVSDQGLMALAEAPNLSRLRICRDESRRITPEGIAKLKERIPHLRVEEF